MLGNDALGDGMHQRTQRPGQPLMIVPKRQREGRLHGIKAYAAQASHRDEAIVPGNASGRYTLPEIGGHVGLHCSRRTRNVRLAEVPWTARCRLDLPWPMPDQAHCRYTAPIAATVHGTRMSGQANSRKAIFLALGANFAIFVAKLFAALITGSGAMLAEAVHSLADCGNQGLLLLGMRQARRPPSDEYPLGWGVRSISGRSWWRSCCSVWAACFPSMRASTSGPRRRR